MKPIRIPKLKLGATRRFGGSVPGTAGQSMLRLGHPGFLSLRVRMVPVLPSILATAI